MQSQCSRILDHLQTAPLDPLTAWQQLGVYRLAARIADLRAAGYTIERRTKEVSNRWGEVCRVAEYHLQR